MAKNNGVMSAVGRLQIVSDKLRVSMNADAQQFYSRQTTVMDLTETARCRHTMTRDTIVVYLPVSFTVASKNSVPADLIEGMLLAKMRIRRPQALDESIFFSLRLLLEAALREMVCRKKW